MCSTCGCDNQDGGIRILMPGNPEVNVLDPAGIKINTGGHHHHHEDHPHAHDHHHDAGHTHSHDHDHHHDHHHDSASRQVMLEKNILHENDLLAQRNRGYLDAKNIYALNLVSSPGAGKTTILEKTIPLLHDIAEVAIVEGDLHTMHDADRIAKTGAQVVQINTGKGCHLDAHMVLHAMRKMTLKDHSILFIENVGNLVCPSLFDLGEKDRVVIASLPEGDDKPAKYPYMFESATLCIINKIDLQPYVNFDMSRFKDFASRINPKIQFIEMSATTGQGMELWISWLKSNIHISVNN